MSASGPDETATQAKAHLAAGSIAYYQGDNETTDQQYRKALAIYQALDDRHGIAEAILQPCLRSQPGRWLAGGEVSTSHGCVRHRIRRQRRSSDIRCRLVGHRNRMANRTREHRAAARRHQPIRGARRPRRSCQGEGRMALFLRRAGRPPVGCPASRGGDRRLSRGSTTGSILSMPSRRTRQGQQQHGRSSGGPGGDRRGPRPRRRSRRLVGRQRWSSSPFRPGVGTRTGTNGLSVVRVRPR